MSAARLTVGQEVKKDQFYQGKIGGQLRLFRFTLDTTIEIGRKYFVTVWETEKIDSPNLLSNIVEQYGVDGFRIDLASNVELVDGFENAGSSSLYFTAIIVRDSSQPTRFDKAIATLTNA